MRLVDADTLLEYLYNKQDEQVDIALEIAEFPTVDAVPVVHGRWETWEDMNLDTVYMCSECKQEYVLLDGGSLEENLYSYCPNCGAKMDGDNNG